MWKRKILLRPGWVRILGWSYWGIHFEEIHFWFANFLTRKTQEIQNLHGWVDIFLRTLFLCAGSPGILPFWAILCLSSHSCTIVFYCLFLCHFYLFSLFQPPDTWPAYTMDQYLQKIQWRPRGVRGRVEDLSAAHPTDLRPRGAFAFIGKNSSHVFLFILYLVRVSPVFVYFRVFTLWHYKLKQIYTTQSYFLPFVCLIRGSFPNFWTLTPDRSISW